MRRTNRSLQVLLIVLMFGSGSLARADSAVIIGAGRVGTWSTTGYVTNPNPSAESLSVDAVPLPCPPPLLCPIVAVTVPPLGSASLDDKLGGGFQTLYVSQLEPQPPAFPLVHASLVNSLDFGGSFTYNRSVDIPVVLLSRLIAADLSTLNFGGLHQEAVPLVCALGAPCFGPLAHSTLVLGNIQRSDGISGEDLPVTLELFDQDGNLLGSGSLTIPYGETVAFQPLPYLLPPDSLSQLRVTRTSGRALMWGVLYTQQIDGAVTASAGVNLSP